MEAVIFCQCHGFSWCFLEVLGLHFLGGASPSLTSIVSWSVSFSILVWEAALVERKDLLSPHQGQVWTRIGTSFAGSLKLDARVKWYM